MGLSLYRIRGDVDFPKRRGAGPLSGPLLPQHHDSDVCPCHWCGLVCLFLLLQESIVSTQPAALIHSPERQTHHHHSLTALLDALNRKPFILRCPESRWARSALVIASTCALGYVVSITSTQVLLVSTSL